VLVGLDEGRRKGGGRERERKRTNPSHLEKLGGKTSGLSIAKGESLVSGGGAGDDALLDQTLYDN